MWKRKTNEFQAMEKIKKILDELADEEALERVLRWLEGVYKLGRVEKKYLDNISKDIEKYTKPSAGGEKATVKDIGRLYQMANPKTESEKALVVGYYLQVVKERSELRGEEINSILKNLGHGVRNVTAALRELIHKKPQLVLEFGKSGKSQQAHKKYRLTMEGIKKVESLLD